MRPISWFFNDCLLSVSSYGRKGKLGLCGVCLFDFNWASLVAQTIKNLPAMWETWVQSLGWENPLEKELATHSSILAWRILRTEEHGRLQSMGLQRAG